MSSLNSHQLEYELRRRGLNAREFSERAGVSRVTVSRIRNGHQQPSAGTLRRLAEALAAMPVLPELDAVLVAPGASNHAA